MVGFYSFDWCIGIIDLPLDLESIAFIVSVCVSSPIVVLRLVRLLVQFSPV